jgi:hypothetical protein
MLPLISFETGRKTHTQSSGQQKSAAPANGSLVLSRNHGREANTRGEGSKKIYTRAPPKRVGRAFALLTKTYHGSRINGKVVFKFPTNAFMGSGSARGPQSHAAHENLRDLLPSRTHQPSR